MLKVTVYIPTHNYGHYIDKAIQSVFKQTMNDWELIIIDDGSTDNTKDVIGKYNSHPKIRTIEQENKGLNVTNNIALRLANGRYIMRLDADDYLDENALLVLSNILDSKSDIGLVYPDYYYINEDGVIIEAVRRKKIGEEVGILDLPAHGACTMIRKECLFELEGYEEAFSCQDSYDLWLKFIKIYKPYNVNIPLFYYRQHSKSITTNHKKILDTRGKIKSKYVEKCNNGQRPKVLGLIPVVGRSIYAQSNPFVDLAGKPLIWYTLNEVQKSKALDKVVLFSEDEEVLEYGKQFKDIIPLKRSYELSKETAGIENNTFKVLEIMEKNYNYRPDAVCFLYITTPLRRAFHIDKAIDTLTIFNVDSVISIQEELSYYYFHRKDGLTPVSKSERSLRVERDALYRENGAIYLSLTSVLRKKRLIGKTVGHINMLPEESVKINSEYEFWLAEKIISEFNSQKNNDS